MAKISDLDKRKKLPHSAHVPTDPSKYQQNMWTFIVFVVSVVMFFILLYGPIFFADLMSILHWYPNIGPTAVSWQNILVDLGLISTYSTGFPGIKIPGTDNYALYCNFGNYLGIISYLLVFLSIHVTANITKAHMGHQEVAQLY